jgi:hypothetical protein
VVYGVTSYEWVGSMLFCLAAAGFALIGLFVRRSVRRADRDAERDLPSPEEPHIGPTIWPFVLAVGAFGVVLGAAISPWILAVGAAIVAVAAVGWFRDVGRQWSHDRHS